MFTMAIDQYGQHFDDLGKHPRAELIKRIGSSHVNRMYVDTTDGTKHIGYVIGGHWLTLYSVERIEVLV